MTIHDKHREWIEARGIEPGLIELYGLDSRKREGAMWLVVPYLEGGKPINHKYRRTTQKDHRMDTGAPLLLWNCDDLREGKETVITEGEWDALSVKTLSMEIPCVSVPNGAPGEMSENPWEAHRYGWFHRHQALLDRVPSFTLATDADAPGRLLAADLAMLLGPERCKFVTYPDDCKDMNEVLMKHGEQAVATVLESAKAYPVKGLYRFSDFPPRSDLLTLQSTLPGVKGIWPLTATTMSIITGWSGIGKTTLLSWVLADYLRQGVTMCVGSFETDPFILRKQIKASLLRCPFYDRRVHEPHEIDEVIEKQMLILAQNCGDEESDMTVEYMLDLARVAALRDGARLFVCDPWNEVEHKFRRHETETEYIGRSIRAIKRFSRRLNVASWVVAHPTKPPLDFTKPPNLYSISGSANWNNKADYGVIIHRRDKTMPMTDLIVEKVRMGLPGKETRTLLDYNQMSCGFDPNDLQ